MVFILPEKIYVQKKKSDINMTNQKLFYDGIEKVNISYAIAENVVFILLTIFGFSFLIL